MIFCWYNVPGSGRLVVAALYKWIIKGITRPLYQWIIRVINNMTSLSMNNKGFYLFSICWCHSTSYNNFSKTNSKVFYTYGCWWRSAGSVIDVDHWQQCWVEWSAGTTIQVVLVPDAHYCPSSVGAWCPLLSKLCWCLMPTTVQVVLVPDAHYCPSSVGAWCPLLSKLCWCLMPTTVQVVLVPDAHYCWVVSTFVVHLI